jgi:hypothetical protein
VNVQVIAVMRVNGPSCRIGDGDATEAEVKAGGAPTAFSDEETTAVSATGSVLAIGETAV